MRTMYDSVSPRAIPRTAQMVAGYIDGLYAWSAEEWGLFPNASKVTITALGRDHGVVLNLEPKGYWPADLGVGWVQRARRRGIDPTIYCNYRNHLHLVRAAFDRAGVARPHFWVAEYDGVQNIPAGCVAKQHTAPEGTGRAKAPGHYDISIVADVWPGVDGDNDMALTDQFARYPHENDGETERQRMSLEEYFRYTESAIRGLYELFFRTGAVRSGADTYDTTGKDLLRYVDLNGIKLDRLLGLTGQLTDDETKVLDAVRALSFGGTDPAEVAKALLPLLSAEVRVALVDVLRRGVDEVTP
ncbi:hypothetical protein SAMN04488074_10598 [Lentzea albidocapillata subsp. violacea]|uniref:Uncharacterized protein n=1 Tax=Lentzea albidocapillata subsp. violacea TaxID=128104 RepID=A0A1G9ASR1_9PSEU|nr:hypothetical protein [Lentzea albidocapillata]SDK29894.1 hypothetical protein SAMN04488074_10598 [Lentzea albidocapillata subsp. violacea]